jgi:hypothetical protein
LIVPDDTLTYTFVNKIDLFSLVDTNYQVKAWISLVGDNNPNNDTIVQFFDSRVALPDPVINDTTIPFGTSVTLTAFHTDSITWSSDPLGANIIKYGSSYTTPVLLDTTVFYVQAGASSGGAFMITEVCHWRGATNGVPVGGWPSWLLADDYLEITGVPNSDLGGFTLEQWSTTALQNSHTFPPGTLLSPNGTAIIAVGQPGSSVPSPANYYYHGNVAVTYSSTGTGTGRIIKDPNGGIVDVVVYGTFTFPAAAGVTAADWTGNTPAISSAGNRLAGPYTKNATNWINSGTQPQDPYVVNNGVTLPSSTGCPSKVKAVKVNVSGIPQYNAGIESIISPVGPFVQNATSPVVVNLKNFASAPLTKVTINHSVNGVARPPYLWTGNLPYNQTTQVTLGVDTFLAGSYTYRAWTSMPNDSVDGYTANDSALAMAYVCLAGTFTLGDANSDFPNFSSLFTILNNVGICGPTTIRIKPGTYNQQLVFPAINGVSAANPLVFESFTGQRSDVTISFSANTTDNYTIRFNGGEYITFKDLTIKGTNVSAGRVIDLMGTSKHISFDNCLIEAPIGTSSLLCPVYSTSSAIYNLSITNSTLKGGYYGIYYYTTSALKKNRFTLHNNQITDYYYYGLYTYYVDSLSIIGNTVTNSTSAGILYPMYIGYTTGWGEISKNRLISTGTSTNYGLYIAYKQATSPNYLLVSNNFISQSGNPTGTIYSVYVLSSNYVNFYNNSVHVTGGSATGGRAFFLSSGSFINIVNNTFSNTNGGYAYYISAPAAVITADYNNFYSTSSNLAYWNSDQSTLAALKLASGKETNSINVLPPFTATHNLALTNTLLSGKATPLAAVPDDIFGNPRTSIPTIGAHEIPLINKDAGVISFIMPTPQSLISEGGNVNVTVEIQNFGTDTLNSVDVYYSVNGGTPVLATYTGQLLPFQTTPVSMPAFNSPAGNTNLCAFTVLPGDSNTFNDTTCIMYYAIPTTDAFLKRIVPIEDGCGMGMDTIRVVVQNNGATTITGTFNLSYRLVGSTTIVTETATGPISVNDSLHYTFAALADFTSLLDSLYIVEAWVKVTGDNVLYNDTATLEVMSLKIPLPPAINDTTIPYASWVTLHALSPDSITWYLYDTSTVELHAGAFYTTPVLFDTTTYWVEAMSGPSNFGVGNGVNIAPLAIANANNCSTGPCSSFNDLNYGTCGTQQVWISTSGGPTPHIDFIDFEWPTAYSMDKITIHHGQTGTRFLSGGDIYVWSGNAWVYHHTFSNLPNTQCENDVLFPVVTTNKFRITSFVISGSQLSNPNFREIEIFSASAAGCASIRIPVTVSVGGIPPYDLGISELLVNQGCAIYNEPVTIKVYNQGTDTLKGGASAAFRVNNNPWIATETIPDTIAPGSSIYYTFNTLANLAAPLTADTMFTIKAWVSILGDPNQQNDSITRDSIKSLKTPAAPTAVSPVNIPYNSSATLTASGLGTIQWYPTQSSTLVLDTGTTFITPTLWDTTTYWASAVQSTQVSASFVSPGGYTGTTTCGGGFMVDVTALSDQITIEALGMHLNLTGSQTVNFFYRVGTWVGFANNSGAWIPWGTYTVNSAGPNQQTYMAVNPLVIPQGQTYAIYWQVSTQYGSISVNTTYANSDIAVLSGMAHCTNWDGCCTPRQWNGAIYYKKGSFGCPSLKTPVVVQTSSPPAVDAGVEAIVNPQNTAASNQPHLIQVRLKNYGLNNLTSANIVWSLNNVVQATIPWTGSLPWSGTQVITLDTMTFAGGVYCIKAWTTQPNGVADLVPLNDTANHCFNACLSGTYTIGPAITGNWDYTTFNQALAALQSVGICGHVIFDVQPGTYTEQLTIPEIPGVGQNQTVTFRGSTGDSTQVTLQYTAAGAADYWTIRFNGADWYTFEKMTIKGLGASYARTLEFTAGAHNNQIKNCVIEVPVGTSSLFVPIYSTSSSSDNYNLFRNNRIVNGYYGIYWWGTSTTNMSKAVTFEGNVIEGFYYYGVYLYYMDSLVFTKNIVRNMTNFVNGYGIYAGYCQNDAIFTKNRIELAPSGTLYGGFYSYYCTGTTVRRGLIANNFISVSGTNTSAVQYPFRLYYSNQQDVFFNSINLTAGGATSRALDVYYGTGNNIRSNYARNTSGGYAYYVESGAAVNLSSNNNWWSSGSNLAFWGGNATTLTNLQTLSGKEAGSQNLNIPFVSVTDLHLMSSNLSGKGVASPRVPDDIDGEPRSPVPTIGADEIPLIPIDAGITAILTPGATTNEGQVYPVQVVVTNFGTDTIHPNVMNIEYTVNGGTPFVTLYTGPALPTFGTATVTLQSMTSPAGNSTICAKTALPGDTNLFNDQFCKTFYGNPQHDAFVTRIVGLVDDCNIGMDTISIWIRNLGAAAINSPSPSNIVASYRVNGSLPAVTQPVTQVINPNDSVLFHFTTQHNFVAAALNDSVYNVVAWVDLQSDNVKYNDTAKFTVTSKLIPPSPLAPAVTTPYATQALLTATSPSNDTILWFTHPTTGSHFHMGSTYTTGLLYSDTTFYVQAVGALPLQSFTLGTGTMVNTNTTYPTPYGNWYWGNREQYLLLASELSALGMVAGEIASVAFDVVTPQGVGLQGFTIKMGHTSVSSMTTTFQTSPMTTVYTHPAYVDVAGWNVHNFSTPFQWNGTSNVLVEVCFNNSSYTYNGVVRQTATPFVSVTRYNSDAATVCTQATGSTVSQRPNMRIVAGGDGCASARVPLQVFVSGQQACDVGVTSILEPMTAVNLGSQENIKLRVNNFGTSAQSNIPVNFKVDNLPTITETITATIPANGYLDYTFVAKANMSVAGNTYQLKAWTGLSCDATPQNDTMWKSATHLLPNYCNSTATSALYSEITNVILGTMNHTSTASGAMYTNHSAVAVPPMLSPGVSYPMSITSSFAPGTTTVYTCWTKAWIDFNRDGVFDPATEEIFNTGTTNNNTVTANIQVPLTAMTGNTVMRVVLNQTSSMTAVTPCNTYTYGETEDYMVMIAPQAPCDAGVTQIITPTSLTQSGVALPVWIRFMNFGSNPIAPGTLSIAYKLNSGTPVVVAYPGGLAVGASDSIQMPSVTLPIGNNTFCAYTILACDSNTFNNEICMGMYGQYQTNLPYFDDFETSNMWYKPATSTNWQYGTPSANVINTAYSGNKAWVTNLTGDYSNSADEYLYTPLFSFNGLSGLDTITLSFYHWNAMATSDYGRVQYSINGGQSWSTLGFYLDQEGTNWYNVTSGGLHYFSHTNSGWMYSAYRLSPATFNGQQQVQFRFQLWSNASGTANGWAIDNFRLALPQVPNDIGVTAINAPLGDTAAGANVNATVTITNFGLNTQNMFPVVLKVNGNVVATETWTGTLPSLGTTSYTFIQSFPAPNAPYALCARTNLTGDAFPMNDEFCKNYGALPAYHDVGVTQILAPMPDSINQICFYDSLTHLWYKKDVIVRIQNFGQNAQTSIPISYSFFNGGQIFTDTWTGSLQPGATVDVTLQNQFPPRLGAQQVCVETALPGDPIATNNKACKSYVGVTCIGIDEADSDKLMLLQNMPNPAGNTTIIGYNVPQAGKVTFGLVNMVGQMLSVERHEVVAGYHEIELDVNSLAAGVYYYFIEFNGQRLTRKMVVSR